MDGHVRAYHGKHAIAKACVTRMHLAAPATTDYWINDQRGDPLFVVTADANAAMTKMIIPVLSEVRQLLGPRRHSTVVFDRGGWSPKQFRSLLAMGFDILTTARAASATSRKTGLLCTRPGWTVRPDLVLRSSTGLVRGYHFVGEE
jgi:hypothetical protein